MTEQLVFLNGNFVKKSDAKISVFDHGVLYGDGVFEGIRAYNNRVFRLDDHIDRLYCSAKTIMIEIPYTKKEIAQIVVDSFKKNNMTDGYCRLVVTRGVGDLGLSPDKCIDKATVFSIADKIMLYPEEMYKKGIPVITAQTRRNNATIIDPQIKSLNYLNNIMAKIEANSVGAYEAIMLTTAGIVAECTADNIFIVKDNVIYTPPIHCGALDGITRQTIMMLAKKNGYEVYEKEFTLFNLYNASECFITGTGAECIAVTEADGRVIGSGVAGKITVKLLELFHEYVRTAEAGTDIK